MKREDLCIQIRNIDVIIYISGMIDVDDFNYINRALLIFVVQKYKDEALNKVI